MSRPTRAQLFLSLCLIGSMTSCGGSAPRTATSPTQGEVLLAQGREALSLGVLPPARQAFQRVIDEGWPQAPEAHLGLGLVEALTLLDVASFVADAALPGPSAPNAPPMIPRAYPSPATDENEFLYGTLLSVVGPVLRTLEAAGADFETARSDPSLRFSLPSLPLYFRRTLVADLGGTWDALDARAAEGAVKTLTALVETLASQDLQADFLGAYEYAKPRIFVNGIDINSAAVLRVPTVLNFVTFVLNDPFSALLLTPSPEDLDGDGVPDGQQMLGRAGLHLGQAADDVVQAIQGLRAQRDQRSGHLFRVVSVALKTRTEEDLSIEARFRNSATEVLEDKAIHFPIRDAVDRGPDPVVEGFETMTANLLSGGPPVAWGSDLSPVVLSIGLGILRSVDLSTLGLSLPPQLQFFLQASPPPLSVAQGLLLGVVPDALQLDLAAFFRDPLALRTLLPAWRSDLGPDDNNFLFEWECPEAIPPGARVGSTGAFPLDAAGTPSLLCPKGGVRVDAPHFGSDPTAFADRGVPPIPADGLRSAFPYLPFPDPTFHGLLYFDVGPIGAAQPPTFPAGMAPANNYSFNAFLQVPLGIIRP